MLSTYLYMGIGLGANYLFNIFLARQLGVELFGTYSLGLTIFNIVVLLATCSLDQAAVRYTRELTESGKAVAARFKSSLLLLGTLASLPGVAALLIASRWVQDPALARALVLFSACVMPSLLLTLLIAILQAHHIVGDRLLIKYIAEPLIKILSAAALLALGLSLDAPIAAMLMGATLAVLFALVWKRDILIPRPFSASWHTSADITRFCLPLIAASIFTIIAARADILIMGWFLPHSAIALYAAALQTSAILTIVLQAAETVSTSRFSTFIHRGDSAALANEFRKATRWSLIVGLPLFVAFVCNPGVIMRWFGQEFAEAAAVFQMLCLGQVVNLVTGPSNPILIMAGKTRTVMLNDTVYGVLVIAAVYIGARQSGLMGAAVAVVGAGAALKIARLLWVYHYFHCHPYSSYFIKLAFAGLLPITLFSYLGDILGLFGLLAYPLLTIVLLLAFGPCGEDRKLLNDYLRRMKLQWKEY